MTKQYVYDTRLFRDGGSLEKLIKELLEYQVEVHKSGAVETFTYIERGNLAVRVKRLETQEEYDTRTRNEELKVKKVTRRLAYQADEVYNRTKA